MESPIRGNGKKGPLCGAAIDLGSNSFRLFIAEMDGPLPKPFVNRLETVALGKDISPGSRLSPSSRRKAEEVLRSFGRQLRQYAPRFIRACGTEALRQAADSHEFLAAAKKFLGCEVEILSGEEEARLAYEAAVIAVGSLEPPLLMVDAGGGSTELVALREAGAALRISSVPVGALNLTDRFEGAENGDPDALLHLRGHLKALLSPVVKQLELNRTFRLVGSGGTATAMAALALELRQYDPQKVHGYRMSTERMEEVYSVLIRLSAAGRSRLPGLEKGRGRIIIAGMEIFRVLFALTESRYMTVSDTGLLEGIFLSALPSNGTLVRL